ncbi:MAG: dihydroorotase [Cyclobacteriaceae bacterium]
MKLRLANATIFDFSSKFHLEKVDLIIVNGVITQIGNNLSEGKSIDLEGKILSPGWVDLFANFNEPGFEHKEDIQSGVGCAISGGFTDVCLIPNTSPALETKGDIQFILKKSNEIDLLPIAALSEGLKGENLTEILDLHSNGAVAFSDGLNPIWNTELLLKALQYVQKFDGLVIQRPRDLSLSQHAQMHEGVVSTALGLNGEPSVSEVLTIQRDLEVLKYADGKIHFSQISTKKSVDLIKKAKKAGLKVTCDVSINHLLYTEEHLSDFDTAYKVSPPFRSEKDRRALIKGLNEGVIDAITSSHQPQDSESKELEFDLADFGISSMETVFPSLLSIESELPLEVGFDKLTNGPRKILGLDEVRIEEGGVAKLAVFDKKMEWKFDHKSSRSKSQNSPVFNTMLKGMASGVINKEFVSLQNL